jgi:hypothetical protein
MSKTLTGDNQASPFVGAYLLITSELTLLTKDVVSGRLLRTYSLPSKSSSQVPEAAQETLKECTSEALLA